MNKSFITNCVAIIVFFVGYFLSNSVIQTMGLFAISGALTNWLAIHMLFERVPGLYGSGVIPERFEEVKAGLSDLMKNQFFSPENIQRFTENSSLSSSLDFAALVEKVDLSPTFDSLISVIKGSSFGPMLGMFGGDDALTPLRQPFIEKMTQSFQDITQDPAFNKLIQEQAADANVTEQLQEKVMSIVDQRLDELTPAIVKEIVQSMIKAHLGWLVVWGGVFGGLIGLLTSFI